MTHNTKTRTISARCAAFMARINAATTDAALSAIFDEITPAFPEQTVEAARARYDVTHAMLSRARDLIPTRKFVAVIARDQQAGERILTARRITIDRLVACRAGLDGMTWVLEVTHWGDTNADEQCRIEDEFDFALTGLLRRV